MVQIETSFNSGHWTARGTAYTQFDDIAEFATRLSTFAENFDGEVSFEAGREDGPIGFLSLRFYALVRSGRFLCHVMLATDAATSHRQEEVWKVSVELTSEAAALDTFVRGLRSIANSRTGRAVLTLRD